MNDTEIRVGDVVMDEDGDIGRIKSIDGTIIKYENSSGDAYQGIAGCLTKLVPAREPSAIEKRLTGQTGRLNNCQENIDGLSTYTSNIDSNRASLSERVDEIDNRVDDLKRVQDSFVRANINKCISGHQSLAAIISQIEEKLEELEQKMETHQKANRSINLQIEERLRDIDAQLADFRSFRQNAGSAMIAHTDRINEVEKRIDELEEGGKEDLRTQAREREQLRQQIQKQLDNLTAGYAKAADSINAIIDAHNALVGSVRVLEGKDDNNSGFDSGSEDGKKQQGPYRVEDTVGDVAFVVLNEDRNVIARIWFSGKQNPDKETARRGAFMLCNYLNAAAIQRREKEEEAQDG